MAIQDFVSGGFYGKVGALVGQRWKNKRTVRSYVIPHNPRTELQQSNRSRFAAAVQYAQIALVFNKGSPMWQSAGVTEFQRRVGQAKRAVDNGESDWLAVPLYPSGSTPSTILADVRRTSGSPGQLLLSSVTLSGLQVARRFFFQVCLWNTETSAWDLVNIMTTSTPGSSVLCNETVPTKYDFSEGVTIFGITNDDSEHEGQFIYIPPQDTADLPALVVDDLMPAYDGEDYIRFSSVKSGALTAVYSLEVTYHVYDSRGGTLQTKSATVSTTVGGSYWFRVPCEWYESMKGETVITASVASAPSGARAVTVPPQNVTGNVKQVTGHMSAGVATCVSTNRTRANILVTLDESFDSAEWSAVLTATYTSNRGNFHDTESVGYPSGSISHQSVFQMSPQFGECPTPVSANVVMSDVNVANEWIIITDELASNIADPTATQIDIRGWTIADGYDYVGFEKSISAADYTTLSGLGTIQMLCNGQSMLTGTHAENSEAAAVAFHNDGGGSYSASFELERVFPKSGGAFQLVQSDYATAATVYYFVQEAVSLGKITVCGDGAMEEYLFVPSTIEGITFSGGVGSGTWGTVKSLTQTTFANRVLSDSTLETTGGQTLIATGATWTVISDTPPRLTGLVSVDMPYTGSVTYAEIGLDIENAMFDVEKYVEWSE